MFALVCSAALLASSVRTAEARARRIVAAPTLPSQHLSCGAGCPPGCQPVANLRPIVNFNRPYAGAGNLPGLMSKHGDVQLSLTVTGSFNAMRLLERESDERDSLKPRFPAASFPTAPGPARVGNAPARHR